MNKYPNVLSELDTLNLAFRAPIARVGEGELRIALEEPIKSQTADKSLAAEMRSCLATKGPALVCLPRIWSGMPAETFWRNFATPKYNRLYGLDTYGSAFISRADVAHNIDCASYWNTVRALWKDKAVVLASRSLKVVDLRGAKSVEFVQCPPVNAYAKINQIEEAIGTPSGLVLLAMGPTATVLAVRLARKGVHALDIGHMGRFMASAGAFSVERYSLISDAYILQNRLLHKRPGGYGGSGRKRADDVFALAKEINAETILDYGCGQGTLKQALLERQIKSSIEEYDPAVKGKDGLPKPADLVVCTDVLEHIEPDKLNAVLTHLYQLTSRAAYIFVALRVANKTLPDGRNAHLIVEDSEFWLKRLTQVGFLLEKQEVKPRHAAKFWLTR